jgi:rfaE bifunctional protein kinase chain/domain
LEEAIHSIDANILQDLNDLANVLRRITVLVVGDVMLDRYWWGGVSRISPEAPVPVVRLQHSTLAAGGAANVAANVAGLSAKALLVGIIGDDDAGRELSQTLLDVNVSPDHLLTFAERPTTVKTRIVAHNQHVVRIDNETEVAISKSESEKVANRVLGLLPDADVLVLSDYAKGLLGAPLLRTLIDSARQMNKPVLVDPKGIDYKRYSGATVLTPNRMEAAHACGIDGSDEQAVKLSGMRLMSELEIASCLITQGEEGMTLFARDQPAVHLTAMARKVYDVTGAGDTVIAALSLAIGAGANVLTASWLANLSAGLAVEQVGTTVLNLDSLHEHLENLATEIRLDERESDVLQAH